MKRVFLCLLAGGFLFYGFAREAPVATQQSGTGKRHQAKLQQLAEHSYDLMMIGDSIIHTLGEFGGKYEGLSAVWEKYYAPLNAINLGYSGARTENILWNLQNGELENQSPKLVVLLIGTNDADDRCFKSVHTAEEVLEGTRAIVEWIRGKCPTTKILILRIFPRGGDGEKGVGGNIFHASPSCIETLRKAGALTKSLADGEHVFWLDIGDVFLNADGTIHTELMPDLLHPNAKGAAAWAEAILPTVRQLMQKPSVEVLQPTP